LPANPHPHPKPKPNTQGSAQAQAPSDWQRDALHGMDSSGPAPADVSAPSLEAAPPSSFSQHVPPLIPVPMNEVKSQPYFASAQQSGGRGVLMMGPPPHFGVELDGRGNGGGANGGGQMRTELPPRSNPTQRAARDESQKQMTREEWEKVVAEESAAQLTLERSSLEASSGGRPAYYGHHPSSPTSTPHLSMSPGPMGGPGLMGGANLMGGPGPMSGPGLMGGANLMGGAFHLEGMHETVLGPNASVVPPGSALGIAPAGMVGPGMVGPGGPHPLLAGGKMAAYLQPGAGLPPGSHLVAPFPQQTTFVFTGGYPPALHAGGAPTLAVGYPPPHSSSLAIHGQPFAQHPPPGATIHGQPFAQHPPPGATIHGGQLLPASYLNLQDPPPPQSQGYQLPPPPSNWTPGSDGAARAEQQ